jgi:trehalose 6-phosphate synthase
VSPAEARRRMRSMRRRVREHDVAYWAASFLSALEKPPPTTDLAEAAPDLAAP